MPDASLTGTPTAVTLTAGSADITVPADAKAVMVTWTYFNTTDSSGLTTASLESVAPGINSQRAGTGDQTSTGILVWFNPGTGAGQTLAMTFDAATTEGPNILATYIKDCATDALRTSGMDADEFTTAATLTLNGLTVGDLVVMHDQINGGTPPSTSAGWNSAQTQTVNSESSRLTWIAATGASQVCTGQDPNYPTIACAAFKASAAVAGRVLFRRGS